MHSRYPAPSAEAAFSPDSKIRLWRNITLAYAVESIKETEPDTDTAEAMITMLRRVRTPTPEAVATREATTGHDVVAFLSLITKDLPDDLKRHIHQGLTSSDLVDFAHFESMRLHIGLLSERVRSLRRAFEVYEPVDTRRVGRTHGQIASPTSWTHQMRVMDRVLAAIQSSMDRYSGRMLIKSPGPTGNTPWIESRGHRVAREFTGTLVPSTQIIPRDIQVEWAALYLRLAGALENLALQIRLGARSEVGEFREGAAARRQGSSSMPHKQNPIDSEKVCGLARVVRGYFTTIAESAAFWEDRDLTNSSVERIVVPDMAAVVEHMLDVMIAVMDDLQFFPDDGKMKLASTWSAMLQTTLQQTIPIGPIEASHVVKTFLAQDDYINAVVQHMYNWMKDDISLTAADRWAVKVGEYLDA